MAYVRKRGIAYLKSDENIMIYEGVLTLDLQRLLYQPAFLVRAKVPRLHALSVNARNFGPEARGPEPLDAFERIQERPLPTRE